MLVLGCDPGVTGCCALVDVDACRVLDILDMPIIRAGKLAWIDGAVLGDWLEPLRPDLAVVELVNYWRGDPHPGRTAEMCRLAGGLEAVLSALSIPICHATPSAWKRRAGLIGKPKDAALPLASARLQWPAGALRLAKHHNRADSGLLALYGRAPPPAAPKPPKRSKAVDNATAAAMAAPVMPLFGGDR